MHNKKHIAIKRLYKWQTFHNQNHSDNENIDFLFYDFTRMPTSMEEE